MIKYYKSKEVLALKRLAVRMRSLRSAFLNLTYRRRALIVFLTANVTLVAISVLYAVHVAHSLDMGVDAVTCRFKETFGIYCPGCGGSRSLYYLLTLDIAASVAAYPPLLPTALILAYVDAVALTSIVKGDPSRLKAIRTWIIILIPVMIILWFFIRNILLLLWGIDILGDVLHTV